jgi:hypothetical protein
MAGPDSFSESSGGAKKALLNDKPFSRCTISHCFKITPKEKQQKVNV